MVGFYTLYLISRGIYSLVFALLVQARSAFISISKECRSVSIYRPKAGWLYILTTLVFIISVPSDEFACLSDSYHEEKFIRTITGSSGLDLHLDSHSLENGVQRPDVEQSIHGCTLNYSYAHTIVIPGAWLRFGEIRQTSTPIKPAVRTSGCCKYMLKNGVLGLVMEHSHQRIVLDCCYVHAFVISRACPEINEIPSSTSSIFINSAMEALGYSKSFLCSWRSILSAPSVECAYFSFIFCEETVIRKIMVVSAMYIESDSYWLKYGVLGLMMEHSLHGHNVNCYSDFVVIWRAWQEITEIPSSVSSTFTNLAIEASEYSKSFLFSWRCTLSCLPVQCVSFSVISCEERGTRNITDVHAMDVESDIY